MRYLEETAVKAAKDLASGTLKVVRGPKTLIDKIMNFALSYEFVKNQVFTRAKNEVIKKTGGLYPAPLKILDVIRTGIDKGHKAGYEAEAKAFGELAVTPQCKGLISLFFGQTTCKRNRFGAPKNATKYIYFDMYYYLSYKNN